LGVAMRDMAYVENFKSFMLSQTLQRDSPNPRITRHIYFLQIWASSGQHLKIKLNSAFLNVQINELMKILC